MLILKLVFRFFHAKYNYFINLKNRRFRNKANKIIADLYLKENKVFNQNKNIICEALWDNPHHWLRLAIFIPVLKKHLKSKVMGVFLAGTNKETIKTFKSFKFDFYKEIKFKISEKHNYVASQLSKKIKTLDDIFKLDIPYGYPGSFLYDSILKTEMIGNIDINKINIKKYIAKLICFLEIFNNIIDPQKVSAVVVSHPVNFRFSAFVYIALMKNVPVYIISYINEYLTIRKLEKIEDWINGGYEKPDFDEVKNLSIKHQKYLEDIGNKYIKKVRSAERGQISIIGTFKTDSLEKFNKNELLKTLNLDSKKLTAIIMTGCWPDFPNIYPKTFYLDYVDWFTKTLGIIKNVKHINWIIKPHPAEFMYGSKTKSNYFIKDNDFVNIKFWPSKISTNHLLSIADVIITSHGSAGFEYPAIGIPVIITKKTNYADWGFNYCCFNYKKYNYLLSNLNQVKPPSLIKQSLAKIFMATHICNASNTDNQYLYEMGALSHRLWPTINEFVLKNEQNIQRERKVIKKWLCSNNQSYNFYKSVNFELWEQY